MNRISVLLITLVSSLAAQQTTTQPTVGWRVDKNHSNVSFTIAHMVVSEVSGRFRDFDISVTSSKDDFSDATFDATLKVDSLDTGNPRRDNHLKADDFFNAPKFPNITFKSTAFKKTGDMHYAIEGDLTIRDVTKRVMWDAALKGIIKGGNGTTAAWKATLAIDRFDYNLKWNRTIDSGGLIAGDTVRITVVCELRKPS